MKPGDLVKRKEGYVGHKMCGVGLVLFADGIVAKVDAQHPAFLTGSASIYRQFEQIRAFPVFAARAGGSKVAGERPLPKIR